MSVGTSSKVGKHRKPAEPSPTSRGRHAARPGAPGPVGSTSRFAPAPEQAPGRHAAALTSAELERNRSGFDSTIEQRTQYYARQRARVFDELIPTYEPQEVDGLQVELHDDPMGGTGVKFAATGSFQTADSTKRKDKFTFEPRLGEDDTRFEQDHLYFTLLTKADQPAVPIFQASAQELQKQSPKGKSASKSAPKEGQDGRWWYHGYVKAKLPKLEGDESEDIGRKPSDWTQQQRIDVSVVGIFCEFTGQGDRKLMQLKTRQLSDGTKVALQCDGNTSMTDYRVPERLTRTKEWKAGGGPSVPTAQELLFREFVHNPNFELDLDAMRDAAWRIENLIGDSDIEEALAPYIARVFSDRTKKFGPFLEGSELVAAMKGKRDSIVEDTEALILQLHTDRKRVQEGKQPLGQWFKDEKILFGGVFEVSKPFFLINTLSQRFHQKFAKIPCFPQPLS